MGQDGHDDSAAGVQTSPTQSPSRLRSVAKKVMFAIVPLVVLDVLVSITVCRGGRLLEWPLPPYELVFVDHQRESLERMGTDEESDPYRRFDPVLGWTIRANGRSEDGLMRANSAGLRSDREYDQTPPAGVTRVAAFGESYTHGFQYVSNDETWPYLLDELSDDIEVINFGVDAHGTDQAFIRYQRESVGYKPDVVLIGFMIENILRNVTVYRPAYVHTGSVGVKPRFRLDSGGALELVPCPVGSSRELRSLVESGDLIGVLGGTDYWIARAPMAYEQSPLFWSSTIRIGYGLYENFGRGPQHYYADVTSEPFRVSAEILRAFHARAIADGAQQAVVLIFGDPNTVRARLAGKDRFWTTLNDFLTSANIPFIDLVPDIVAAVEKDGMKAIFRGGHYTPKGNAIVARIVAERLNL
jgi:hypothetical protein